MKTTRLKSFLALAANLLTLCSAAIPAQQISPKLQNAVGHWQVVNGDGSPGGKVDTYIEAAKLFGRVTEVRPGRTPMDLCDKCSGQYRNQLILGMVIMRNFHAQGDDWIDGTAVDPENGKEYKAKIWAVDKDTLRMRGFIGISLLGRTETWKRIP